MDEAEDTFFTFPNIYLWRVACGSNHLQPSSSLLGLAEMDLLFNFQTQLLYWRWPFLGVSRVTDNSGQLKRWREVSSFSLGISTCTVMCILPSSHRSLRAAQPMKHSQSLSNCSHDWFLRAGLQSVRELIILCSPVVQIFLSFQQRQQNHLALQAKRHYSDSQEDF